VGYVTGNGMLRNAYEILADNPKRREHFEEMGIGWKIILIQLLKK
jgi:hypothetical protein